VKIRILLALLLPVITGGCAGLLNTAGSSEFSCGTVPGVSCKTPFQVYEMAINDDGGNPDAPRPAYSVAPTASQQESAGGSGPLPIREPAMIMRIWVAPWTDKNDDLYWPSYLFTEIQPRRWSVGKPEFVGVNPIIPHRLVQPVAPLKEAPRSAPPASTQGASESLPPVDAPAMPNPDEVKLD
jgi:conjugal transfer pilus assembly protein TraV